MQPRDEWEYRRKRWRKKPKKPGSPASVGPGKGCGTGKGGFKAGNNCAKEDGIPNKPLHAGGALKKSNPAQDKALYAQAKAAQDKRLKIAALKKAAAAKKAAKDSAAQSQAAADKAAADKKKAAMLQKIRVGKANQKIAVVGTPKSIKQEIEELKIAKANKDLKVVGTPKTVQEELQEIKDRLAAQAKKQTAPSGAEIGGENNKTLGQQDQAALDKDRELLFGAQNADGWKYPTPSYSASEATRKRVKHEIAMNLASRLDKMGIKESDITDQSLSYFDYTGQFYGSTTAFNKLDAAGVPKTMYRRYALAAAIVKQWAETSGDSNYKSVGIQYAIRKELKVTGSRVDHFGSDHDKHYGGKKTWRKDNEKDIKAIQDDKGVRAVVRAQYQATQEHLKKAGITKLTLVRGYKGSTPAGAQELTLQPATSFSMHKSVAQSFMGGGKSKRGIVVTVPASKIFSTCVTGNGCLNEQEVVILGGKTRGSIWHYGSKDSW